MRKELRPFLLLSLILLSACAGRTAAGEDAREFRDRSVLTHEQLNATAYQDAYQAIETLRSHWLRTRGPSSPNPNSPDEVWVVLNGSRLGGVETLRSLSTREITYVRFYDAASASARFGRGYTQGAIFVSTERL